MHDTTESVGIIYGDVGSTEFNFTVNTQKVRKFDYIAAPHKEGWVLAQVLDIKRFSDLKAQEASLLTANGEVRPIKTNVSAFADVIGYRDKRGQLQAPRTPFDTGSQINLANEDLIRHVLGLQSDKQNGAYMGMLKGHNLPVHLNIDSLVQKHICILAKTGGGKSYACGVLVEELLKKKVPLVIIDTHGEYTSLTKPNKERKDQKNMEKYGIKPRDYSGQITSYSPLGSRGNMQHIALNGMNLEAREIADLLHAKLSGPQIGVLYQAIKELKEYKTTYTIRDIIENVNQSKSNAKWNVIASLESLDAINVFSENGTPTTEFVKKNKCSTINMKGVPPDIQDVVVARLTKELFEDRKLGKIPPFLLIVEEAHNYCPERGFGNAVSSSILRTVASEGRKFGMGLCIVSQRPAKVDKNIISQCNTNIILKVTNPNDLKAIINSVEGLTTQTYNEIQRLPIGTALVSGASIQIPIMVEIRTRETSHGGRSVTVFKDGEPQDFTPKLPKMPAPPQPIDYTPTPPKQTSPTPQPTPTPPPQPNVTQKAQNIHRVASRLGWAKDENPEHTIKMLSEEAKKMKEDPHKYLDSIAKLGQNICQETQPHCTKCPMQQGCQYQAQRGGKRGLFRRT